jgi:hypothetical protein
MMQRVSANFSKKVSVFFKTAILRYKKRAAWFHAALFYKLIILR